jgi:hypothetical protein
MQLVQIVYHSRNRLAPASGRPQLDMLRAILASSRRNNAETGLTGFLLFDRTWFFQVVEGERRAVLATYERIGKDPRHADVTLLALRDIPARTFPSWSMGAAMLNLDQREIYLRHGISGALDPTQVTASTVVALAVDLQGQEIEQQRSLQRLAG